jgi:hypothetical protein
MRDPLEWPSWWPGCRAVRELAHGDAERVGARFDCEWHGRVRFPVRFEFEVEEVSPPRLMRGRAAGAVSGTGTWRLFEEDGVTALTYEWEVRLTRAWMRAVPRPLLAANHDWVMRRGREGLARRLRGG